MSSSKCDGCNAEFLDWDLFRCGGYCKRNYYCPGCLAPVGTTTSQLMSSSWKSMIKPTNPRICRTCANRSK